MRSRIYLIDDSMINDLLGAVGIVQSGERLLVVISSRRKRRNHHCATVPSKVVLGVGQYMDGHCMHIIVP